MRRNYKTLYFDDTPAGRQKLQAEFDRLVAAGWQVTSTQPPGQGTGISSTAIRIGVATSGTPKLMIVMERWGGR
jgi:hypothetical protein